MLISGIFGRVGTWSGYQGRAIRDRINHGGKKKRTEEEQEVELGRDSNCFSSKSVVIRVLYIRA